MTDSCTDLVSLLEDVADYLEPYADADGGPDGYKPNAAMSLGLRVENEIERLKSSNGPSKPVPGVIAKRWQIDGDGNMVTLFFDTLASMESFLQSQRGSSSATSETP